MYTKTLNLMIFDDPQTESPESGEIAYESDLAARTANGIGNGGCETRSSCLRVWGS